MRTSTSTSTSTLSLSALSLSSVTSPPHPLHTQAPRPISPVMECAADGTCRERHTRDMDTLFLIAHPLRWRLIELLASGEHSAGQLADAVQGERGIGREAVSKHLNRLARAGFVTIRRDMNARIYRLSPRVIGAIAGLVDHLVTLRAPAHFDDLDLDGRELDMGAEEPPDWIEEGERSCWCIRKSRQIGAL